MSAAQRDEFWADAHILADAVKSEARTAAYLATGGSDGCARCTGQTFAARVATGHLDCAEALAMTKGARATASNLGEVWIRLSRVMEDPRFGQWLTVCEAAE